MSTACSTISSPHSSHRLNPQLKSAGLTLSTVNSMRSVSGGSSEASDPLESDYSEEDCEAEGEDYGGGVSDENVDQEDDNEDELGDEVDDGNETNEDDSSEESSSLETTKGIRKYHLDDFQIIKTVGTGTFGRVCLCKDKKRDKFCAMKILAMADVVRLKQIDHVKNEKNILQEINHPFVISLQWSTKDDCCLYMLFEYVSGGELFSYLRNAGRFSNPTANFFAAEIVLALEYLHSLQIVYRDLKPENLLINRDGHLKITDFGFAKKLRDRTWTLCGTPEYLAPEIIQSKGHNRAVDWWALGILIYEMLAGFPPFYDDNPFGIYEKILGGKIEFPRHMDPIGKDLVKKLLVLDRTKRLGNMKNNPSLAGIVIRLTWTGETHLSTAVMKFGPTIVGMRTSMIAFTTANHIKDYELLPPDNGADDVKRHRWFKHLNWNDVINKKLRPPILPEITSDGDTSNFDEYPETDWKPARALDQSEMQLFSDF